MTIYRSDGVKKAAQELASLIAGGKKCVAFTGAGISKESEIPTFRGKGGLWDKYDPAEYASIDSFNSKPDKVWHMLEELYDVCLDAMPNKAHKVMAKMEEDGQLVGIITQNIDGLHQRAGSKDVVEFHGGIETLSCRHCHLTFKRKDVLDREGGQFPMCDCGRLLKPDFVFFGEPIPQDAITHSYELINDSQIMICVGTSGVVVPAAQMPYTAKQSGLKVFEVNPESTPLTGDVADVSIMCGAVEFFTDLEEALEEA